MPRSNDVESVNLQALAQFQVLMQERHVSRAAERLGIGQPALSAALARLRRRFEDPLLVRTAQGMVPTPKALELAERVRQALELLDPGRLRGNDFDAATSSRHFRLRASEGLALLFAPPLAAQLRRLAPGVRLTIQPSDMRHTVEALREQECDMTITNFLHAPTDLRHTLVYRQRACCIVGPAHEGSGVRMTLQRFLGHPHVLWGAESVSHRSIETLVRQALNGRELPAGSMRVPNILIVPAVVAATDMIATVPTRIADEAAATLAIRKLQPPFKLADPNIHMYWHELSHRDAGHVWLRRRVVEIAQGLATA